MDITPKQEAIEIADAQLNNFGLPTYSALVAALLACYQADGIAQRRAANLTARDLLRAAGHLGGQP
jgi:hypothetical protein